MDQYNLLKGVERIFLEHIIIFLFSLIYCEHMDKSILRLK
jgi:hypothetical protein